MRYPMRVALTGTPGVGKNSASSLVRSLKVLHVNDLVEGSGAVCGYDEMRESKEIDTEVLAKAVAGIRGDVLLEGHLSHLLDPDIAIVLRCSPSVLAVRLKSKGWTEKKIRENVEAEAIDVVLVEALDSAREVCEIDTTQMTSEQVAASIEEIIAGEREKYPVGHVDWSQEVFDWF
jgi:adenylate kinase